MNTIVYTQNHEVNTILHAHANSRRSFTETMNEVRMLLSIPFDNSAKRWHTDIFLKELPEPGHVVWPVK